MNKFFKVYSLMMLLAFLISCNNVKTEKSKEANSPSETATLSVESTGSVENKVPKVFASYFSQMLPNYDFLIRNSLFQEYLYIENLDMVKDKIVKVEQERYTLYNGNKSWEGDGDTQVKIWNYYAFDSDGFITDEYSLFRETPEDGYVTYWFHSKYRYDGNRIYVSTKDYCDNSSSESYYEFTEDGDKLIFKSKAATSVTEYLKDKQIYYPDYSDKSKFTETIFVGDRQINNDWRDGEIVWITEMERGAQVKRQFPYLKRIATETYEFNGEEGVIKLDGEITGKVRRKMHPAGFVEEDEKGPVEDGSNGVYEIKYTKILDAPDEILKKYFEF
ncbi:MAG: hypothetical protein IKR40_12260 [Treponema sp.]|nr:hypothetical protein [Treponema sp.]